MRRVLNFKIQEGVFRDFGPQNEAVGKNDPPRVLLKFEGGSFELIKKFENFFTGRLSGSGPEIHRLVDATEEISLISYQSEQHLFLINFRFLYILHPEKRGFDFKIQKTTQLLQKKGRRNC